MKIKKLLIEITIYDPEKKSPRLYVNALKKVLVEELPDITNWETEEVWGVYSTGLSFDGEIEIPGRIKDSEMTKHISSVARRVISEDTGDLNILITDHEADGVLGE